MPNYTPIALLPYPAMSDAPNGPDQFQQLARAIEPRLINRFKNATERNTRVTRPEPGMLTFREDSKVYEYWNGTMWVGADQSVAVSSRNKVSSGTNRNLTTTESPALVKTTVKLVNPSSLYRMMWTAHTAFSVGYTWTAASLYILTRHRIQVDTGTPEHTRWANMTTSGASGLIYNGLFPVRTGLLPPAGSVTVSTWVTVEKANTTSGTITLTESATELTITGVTTV